MSLAIDIDTVTRVLLADDWHAVADQSFTLDAYEFLWSGQSGLKVKDLPDSYSPMIMHSGGQSGVCATGFSFLTTDGSRMAGPLTAILAVRYAGRAS